MTQYVLSANLLNHIFLQIVQLSEEFPVEQISYTNYIAKHNNTSIICRITDMHKGIDVWQ